MLDLLFVESRVLDCWNPPDIVACSFQISRALDLANKALQQGTFRWLIQVKNMSLKAHFLCVLSYYEGKSVQDVFKLAQQSPSGFKVKIKFSAGIYDEKATSLVIGAPFSSCEGHVLLVLSVNHHLLFRLPSTDCDGLLLQLGWSSRADETCVSQGGPATWLFVVHRFLLTYSLKALNLTRH